MKSLLLLLLFVPMAFGQFIINPYGFGASVVLPSFVSATISGSTLTITYSVAVTQGAGYNNSDLDLDMSVGGSNIAVTYSSGNGTATHVYTAATAAISGETVDLDFNGDANSLESASGGDLAAIVSGSVTNTLGASVIRTATTSTGSAWTTGRTFSGLSIGTAAADRVIAIALNFRSASSQAAMTATIGGISATVVMGTEADASNFFYSCIIYAAVPTGTTADLVLSNLTADSGTTATMALSVHRIIGASATAEATGTVTGSTTLSTTINSTAGGVVIAAAMGNAPGPDCTWTNITEETDILTPNSGADTSSTASGTTSGSTVSPQVVFSASTALFCVMTAVTFQP